MVYIDTHKHTERQTAGDEYSILAIDKPQVKNTKAGTMGSLCGQKHSGIGLCNDLPHWSINLNIVLFWLCFWEILISEKHIAFKLFQA